MSEPLAHYVSEAPFDPLEVETLTAEQERFYMASQWRMMWWRLKRHKLAVIAGLVLAFSYFSILIPSAVLAYKVEIKQEANGIVANYS